MIRGIAFDKDGVLVDFDRTWVQLLLDLAAERANGDGEKNLRLLSAAGYDTASNSFVSGSVWAAGTTQDLVDVWDETGDEGERQKLATFINQRCLDCEIIPLFPRTQLQGLFAGLAGEGLLLGLTTNDGEASARQTMDDFGLSPFLSLVVGYDSVKNPKPAADQVLTFCDHSGVPVDEMMVVGDNLHDMEMAAAAGVAMSIGVSSGNCSAEELQPMADFVLDSVMDLPQLLRSENLIENN